MRKVLLASTALIALGSVSAMAADVTFQVTQPGSMKHTTRMMVHSLVQLTAHQLTTIQTLTSNL